MQGPPPKRSIVLIWDTGEETGLWGSRHVACGDLARHIVAHTCVDMIGRTRAPGSNLPGQQDLAGPGEVFVAGPGVLSTGMDRALARVAREFPYATQNRKFDNAAESFFYPRTDAAPYFERRIPYVEFFTGLHEDYHRPSDEVSKIDPAKMEVVARTVYTSCPRSPTIPSVRAWTSRCRRTWSRCWRGSKIGRLPPTRLREQGHELPGSHGGFKRGVTGPSAQSRRLQGAKRRID